MDSEEFAHLVYALIGKKAVEKVFKYKDYAFVHLFTRTQAETLMDQLKGNNYFKLTFTVKQNSSRKLLSHTGGGSVCKTWG